MRVVAAQTDPMQCQVRGDALAGVVVGDTTRASLTAHDRFSNACLEGGDQAGLHTTREFISTARNCSSMPDLSGLYLARIASADCEPHS